MKTYLASWFSYHPEYKEWVGLKKNLQIDGELPMAFEIGGVGEFTKIDENTVRGLYARPGTPVRAKVYK